MSTPLTQGEQVLAEAIRHDLRDEINANPKDRAELEARYGKVWSSEELFAEFNVIGFAAPLVVVTRRSDGAKGSLLFQHNPRYFFFWDEHKDS